MCCAKPVMQKSNVFAYGSVLFTCFCKSCSKTFCIFHRKTPVSLRQFLNKKRLQHSRFSSNFVKYLKEHLWVTVCLILYITIQFFKKKEGRVYDISLHSLIFIQSPMLKHHLILRLVKNLQN